MRHLNRWGKGRPVPGGLRAARCQLPGDRISRPNIPNGAGGYGSSKRGTNGLEPRHPSSGRCSGRAFALSKGRGNGKPVSMAPTGFSLPLSLLLYYSTTLFAHGAGVILSAAGAKDLLLAPRRSGARSSPASPRSTVLGRRLRLLEQRQVAPVPLRFQAVHRNEAQRRRVDTVTQLRRLGAVVEHVAQVRIGLGRPDLRPFHEE